jgi:putative ABC transport system permease protein
MTLISLKLAWRETTKSWSRFIFLFLCIALGVGAIVAVDLFATNVEQAILGDARGLLGGDIELSWRRTMSQNGQDVLDSLSERKVIVSHITELAAMAAVESSQPSDQATKATSQLVKLKALDSFYPLYGKIIIEPPQPTKQLLAPIPSDCQRLPCFGAIAQKSLLIRLDLGLGSELRIGQTNFIITGVLVKEPDKIATAFSLGPRVMISREALHTTELVKTGSRIHERYRLQLADSSNLERWLGELRGRLSQEGVQVNSYRDAQPRLRRFLDQLTLYLGLIGLTILLVGGIGVACTIQGFITQKTPIIAILKTIGADSSQIIKIYLTQSLQIGRESCRERV